MGEHRSREGANILTSSESKWSWRDLPTVCAYMCMSVYRQASLVQLVVVVCVNVTDFANNWDWQIRECPQKGASRWESLFHKNKIVNWNQLINL